MLTIITLEEAEKWDSIVKSFENFDVYYLSGYTKAFEIHGDGQPMLIYYEDEDIRAINVVMKRDIGMDKNFKEKIAPQTYFDLSTPYGYGGLLIEGRVKERSLARFDEMYSRYCLENNVISEIVRFHPILGNAQRSTEVYEVVELGKTITINVTSKDQLLNDMGSENRRCIRKAIKEGVEVYWGRSPQLIDSFIPLYNATMHHAAAAEYYYFGSEFYNSILHDLKNNSLLFYAVFENKVIASTIILLGTDQMHGHLFGSDKEYQKLKILNLLVYETSRWGCENGYKTFHLGGGLGAKEDGIFKCKKQFNKNSDTIFSIGKKIFNPEKYDELRTIRDNDNPEINDSDFFPEYRK